MLGQIKCWNTGPQITQIDADYKEKANAGMLKCWNTGPQITQIDADYKEKTNAPPTGGMLGCWN